VILLDKQETKAFGKGCILALSEVISAAGDVQQAFDGMGFSRDEIEACAEFDVARLREYGIELEPGVELPEGTE